MTYVALLRAINVGGHTVAMDRLQQLFTELGCANVSTFIASGNVIFDATARGSAPALERRIAAHLGAALGFPVETFLRTPQELAKIAGQRPFAARALAAPGTRLFVAFLGRKPSSASVRKLMALRTPTDDLAVAGREIYWLCRVPSNEAAVSGATLEKALRAPATVRNITTVRKLVDRCAMNRAG